MADIEAIRERHAAVNLGVAVDHPRFYCESCRGPVPWPCDAATLLAALDGCERSCELAGATNRYIQDERDAARAERDAAIELQLRAVGYAQADADAARADADRLFWFHEMTMQGGPDGGDLDEAVCQDAEAAARAIRQRMDAESGLAESRPRCPRCPRGGSQVTTDILPAHKALIEAALDAEGLMHEPAPRAIVRLRTALDAYRKCDPTGSTLARWAEVGKVMERLHSWGADTIRLTQDVQSGGWLVECIGYESKRGTGPTLPAAIEAALGEP